MRPLTALVGLALALGLAGCEDEPAPPPPNKPKVTFNQAQCRLVEGVYKLDQVEVVVQDLDGPADLRDPVAVVEATRLPLEGEELPWEGPTDGDGACELPSCEKRYTWEHTSDGLQIYCGADGKLLTVNFEAKDQEGWFHRVLIPAEPL